MKQYVLNEPYVCLPNRVLLDRDLSPNAKLCFARLLHYADENGRAFPKLSTLAREQNVSIRHLQRLLNELKDKELIVIQRRGMGLSNIYTVCSRLSTETENKGDM